MRSPYWLRRPSPRGALASLLPIGLLGVALAWIAARATPLVARASLPLAQSELRSLYLTSLPEDPQRVLLALRRENSTLKRGLAEQAGDPYWLRSYADPARPGLPPRLLLTSRSRGAHLLVPLAALDLERALAEPVRRGEPADDGAPGSPPVGRALTRIYCDGSFAGVYLQLRFPERPRHAQGPAAGEEVGFDLVVVRGNRVCTTDFLLQPNGELYRAALADGLLPAGEFERNPATGDELVFLLWEAEGTPARSLYVPVPLFDELVLCWGEELPTLVDDRWRLEELPAIQLEPPAPALRSRLAWEGALHLAARFEDDGERSALAHALELFGGT